MGLRRAWLFGTTRGWRAAPYLTFESLNHWTAPSRLSCRVADRDNDPVPSSVHPRLQMSLFSDSMDELLPHLLSFPPHPPPPQPLSDVDYDRNIRGLVQTLNQVAASKLTSGVSGGGDLLDVRDI